MKKILKYVVAISIILGLAGCDNKQPTTSEATVGEKIDHTTDTVNKEVTDASKKTGEALDDASITAKVKAAILAEPNLKSLQINVETTNQDVALSGTVDSQEQFTRAQEITSSLAGVKGVRNNLVVKSPTNNTAAHSSSDTSTEKKTGEVLGDTSITAKVKAAILAEPNLKSLQINVETNQGTVTLSGSVDSQEQLKRVKEITSGTSGVKDVKDQMVVKS